MTSADPRRRVNRLVTLCLPAGISIQAPAPTVGPARIVNAPMYGCFSSRLATFCISWPDALRESMVASGLGAVALLAFVALVARHLSHDILPGHAGSRRRAHTPNVCRGCHRDAGKSGCGSGHCDVPVLLTAGNEDDILLRREIAQIGYFLYLDTGRRAQGEHHLSHIGGGVEDVRL